MDMNYTDIKQLMEWVEDIASSLAGIDASLKKLVADEEGDV